MITTDKFVLFWGDQDIYSNFYPAEFEMEGNHFYWSEQAFMWLKAVTFGADDIANELLAMTPEKHTPLECKKLGSRIKNFDDIIWTAKSYDAMVTAVYKKFSQNPTLLKQLLDTNDRILVEASPYDKIWGIGMSETDKDAQDVSNWKGQNLLGKVLMDVRKELK